MSAFVVDASVTAAWLFADEQSVATDALHDRAHQEGAVAPSLWRYEVANLVINARRRRRIDDEAFEQLAAMLPSLGVQIDETEDGHVFDSVHRLAVRHGLTAYDAAYLDLAIRRRAPLATLDGELRRAAATEGVALLP